MTKDERMEVGIDTLPESLEEAIKLYKDDAFMREVLGEHVFYKYLKAKKEEWKSYKARVSQWELDNYFVKY